MTTGLHLDPKELLSLQLPVWTFSTFWLDVCFFYFKRCSMLELCEQKGFTYTIPVLFKQNPTRFFHVWTLLMIRVLWETRALWPSLKSLPLSQSSSVVVAWLKSTSESPWSLSLNHNTPDSNSRWVLSALAWFTGIYLLGVYMHDVYFMSKTMVVISLISLNLKLINILH